VLDIPAPTVARAIGILRTGPLTAARFAQRMWVERSAIRSPGQQSRSGHALLRQLAQVGYAQRIGDLWTLRVVGTADGLGDSAVPTADAAAVGLPLGLPVASGVETGESRPVGAPVGWADRAAERQRLHRLVALATEPVPTVTHDAVLGDIEVRGVPLDLPLEQACAWVTLRGHRTNVYPVGETSEMLVGVTPVEAARALFLRWLQSGVPPELLNEEAWFFADDGLIESPVCWKPEGVDDEVWLCEMEPLDKQVRRQRAAAGLT